MHLNTILKGKKNSDFDFYFDSIIYQKANSSFYKYNLDVQSEVELNINGIELALGVYNLGDVSLLVDSQIIGHIYSDGNISLLPHDGGQVLLLDKHRPFIIGLLEYGAKTVFFHNSNFQDPVLIIDSAYKDFYAGVNQNYFLDQNSLTTIINDSGKVVDAFSLKEKIVNIIYEDGKYLFVLLKSGRISKVNLFDFSDIEISDDLFEGFQRNKQIKFLVNKKNEELIYLDGTYRLIISASTLSIKYSDFDLEGNGVSRTFINKGRVFSILLESGVMGKLAEHNPTDLSILNSFDLNEVSSNFINIKTIKGTKDYIAVNTNEGDILVFSLG